MRKILKNLWREVLRHLKDDKNNWKDCRTEPPQEDESPILLYYEQENTYKIGRVIGYNKYYYNFDYSYDPYEKKWIVPDFGRIPDKWKYFEEYKKSYGE